jgi:hypothetical protein
VLSAAAARTARGYHGVERVASLWSEQVAALAPPRRPPATESLTPADHQRIPAVSRQESGR